jgi:hypothetical protein
MSQSLTLPDELFNKLAHGAAQRGLTVEGLLAVVSELVVLPERPTRRDQQRSRRIERLFGRYRSGTLAAEDRAELDRLIDADYQEAIARADHLLAAKQPPPGAPTASRRADRSSPKPAKRSRK